MDVCFGFGVVLRVGEGKIVITGEDIIDAEFAFEVGFCFVQGLCSVCFADGDDCSHEESAIL